jgi:DNA-directed RNA polymerase subunit RPC12/RpoP
MTKILQKEPIKIKCPHCKQEITEAWICKMNSIVGLRYAYLCSNCQKLLGITPQKDFSIINQKYSINSVLKSNL